MTFAMYMLAAALLCPAAEYTATPDCPGGVADYSGACNTREGIDAQILEDLTFACEMTDHEGLKAFCKENGL